MDAPGISPDQEKEEEQQPSELPILGEKDKSQESSDHVPLPSPSQQEAETRHALATEPFQRILKVLADLERDDPKFAFPTARLVGLYRRLWESCVSKHITNEGCFGQKSILQTRQMDTFEASDTLPGNWRYDRAIELASLNDANIDMGFLNRGQPYECRF
ncbi:hypothetical protein E8E15_002580 [Penicillium rubens]|nr:hypothetical protein E8E15_002580 [Penicillium rubens]